jgi:hypothetical protein
MATDKQIAANRANCKRSTGPKTPAGHSKSSRNALRHGLSLPLSADPQTQANIEALAEAVAGDTANLCTVSGRKAVCGSTPGTDAHSQRLRPSHLEAFNPGD